MNHPRPPSILPLATLKYPRPHAVDGLINQRALSLSVGLGDTGGDVAGIVPRGGYRSWTTACKANEPIAQGSALGYVLLPLWGAPRERVRRLTFISYGRVDVTYSLPWFSLQTQTTTEAGDNIRRDSCRGSPGDTPRRCRSSARATSPRPRAARSDSAPRQRPSR